MVTTLREVGYGMWQRVGWAELEKPVEVCRGVLAARLLRRECVARLQLHAHNRPYPAGLMRYGTVRNHQESDFADDKGIDADALRGDILHVEPARSTVPKPIQIRLASWVFRLLLDARRGSED